MPLVFLEVFVPDLMLSIAINSDIGCGSVPNSAAIGLDWIGLDWIGLDWIGLDWIGLDWMLYFAFHSASPTDWSHNRSIKVPYQWTALIRLNLL
jgi:hypothetical protein